MSRAIIFLLCSLWGATTSLGLWAALRFERTPAAIATPPEQWPTNSKLARDSQEPTLLLFVHPKCPCTRATLRELERILARHRQLTAYAIFLKPDQVSAGWERTDLWKYASSIPGVTTIADEHDRCRKLFHMSASGECLVYSNEGQLVFHGGLTSGRGHEGYSLAQTLLASALSDSSNHLQRTAVFGCPLVSAEPSSEVTQ